MPDNAKPYFPERVVETFFSLYRCFYWGNKYITLRAQCFDETTAVGLFTKNAANLADVNINDSVIWDVFPLQHTGQDFARQGFEGMFEKRRKQSECRNP